jgi:hypothetical protein
MPSVVVDADTTSIGRASPPYPTPVNALKSNFASGFDDFTTAAAAAVLLQLPPIAVGAKSANCFLLCEI